jgi:hypothetical protein
MIRGMAIRANFCSLQLAPIGANDSPKRLRTSPENHYAVSRTTFEL